MKKLLFIISGMLLNVLMGAGCFAVVFPELPLWQCWGAAAVLMGLTIQPEIARRDLDRLEVMVGERFATVFATLLMVSPLLLAG